MNQIETVDVVNEEWDYLIILDACRYDYFRKQYKNHLPQDSVLSKKHSPGSCTNQWRDHCFPDHYDDIVYITANPQICASAPVYGYCAGDHFTTIHEVWKNHWDLSLGTVLPETMTAAALDILRQTDTQNKRVIIHYMQPHAPYLSLNLNPDGLRFQNTDALMGLSHAVLSQYKPQYKVRIYRLLLKLFRKNNLLGNHPDWVLRRWLKLPPLAPMEYVLQNFSTQQLRQAYQENLEKVLPHVAELLKYLAGKIVITSDHGELLGEDKSYSHPHGSDHPILRTVPWLQIVNKQSQCTLEKSQPQSPPADADPLSDEKIIERLRDLGYHD